MQRIKMNRWNESHGFMKRCTCSLRCKSSIVDLYNIDTTNKMHLHEYDHEWQFSTYRLPVQAIL